MTNMELEDLRTFVALAATRSFSGAAKELFLTQSAVTRRLQRLEQALGGSLVDRRRRPLVLTAAGQAMLRRVSMHHLIELRSAGPALVQALASVLAYSAGTAERRRAARRTRRADKGDG